MAKSNGTPSRHDIGELSIDLTYCRYVGTRMQLEAEGVIPADTKWPDGFSTVSWEANGLRFLLKRERPEGAKGPRRAFLDCDNWWLRMSVPGRSVADENIKRMADELARYIHNQSPAGQAEVIRQARLYFAARDDKEFQAFKALIPGLTPKRSGRPSMAAC